MALVAPIRIRVQTRPKVRMRVLPRLVPVDGVDGIVQSIVAGSNVTVDSTDPANPIVSATGGGGGGGSGTVTSVGLTVPTGFTAGGSPVTTSGTLTISYTAGYQGFTTAESALVAAALQPAAIGVSVQAYDADLTIWAGLTPSANAQSLVVAANYAAMRALLDLEAGTDFYSKSAADAAFQPLDASLTAYAALTTAADKAVYYSGADVPVTFDFSSVARTLVGQTTQALMRTTGLGMSANGSSLVSAADYAAMKALLDLEAGTDFNAYSARLADIAGITYAQGDVFYFNGTNIVKLAAGTSGRFLKTQGAGANPVWDDAPGAGGGISNVVEDTTPQLGGDLDLNGHVITGLVIGTNVQAYDADLTAWAAVNPSSYLNTAGIAAAYQPLDSDLTAIAALTPTNDDIVQRKSGAWTNRTMAQLLADLSAVGTTFQPLDTDLTTLAGLTATTNNFIVSVSSAWASRTPAQVKTTLSLDNVDNTSDATKNAASVTLTNKTITTPAITDPVITGTITEDVFTITDGAGFVINPRNGSIQQVTLGANRTPTVSGWVSGDSVHLKVADGTAFTITWTTIGVVWVGGSAPTLATSGFSHMVLWRDGTTYYGKYVGDTAS